jgi:hypothetical protein
MPHWNIGIFSRKTCACQGFNPSVGGASFSFGCSWSMFFNGCKFSRSRFAKKFKLKDESEEDEIERRFQSLATDVAPVFKTMAPQAYSNQVGCGEGWLVEASTKHEIWYLAGYSQVLYS